MNIISMAPKEPNPDSVGMLRTLQWRNTYAGTVSSAERDRRRAANRVAKASRKTNRGK